MCSGGRPRGDNTAEQARQDALEREKRVTEGRIAIDDAFAGYNDDFYNQYQTDYTNYYNPQLSDQYSDARKRLTLQLAKTGNLTSSAGINQMGDLQEYYNNQQTGITNQALDAANSLRGNIDARKSQLYNDNRAAADPGQASSAAISSAAALQPTPLNSPLADSFADFFNALGNYQAIRNRNTPVRREATGVQNYGGGSNNGSYQYIGQ